MFISFFRNNRPSAFVLLPLLAILLWLGAIVFNTVSPSVNYAMPFYGFLAQWLLKSTFLSKITALLLVIINAFLLNYIINENEVTEKRSFIPALAYIVFMSSHVDLQTIHPIHFSTTFLLLSLALLLSSYRKDGAFSNVFNAGVLLSLSILFYLPFIVYLPLLWIAIGILRAFNWREWMIAFIGILFPLIYIFSYYFFTDNLIWFIQHINNGFQFSIPDFRSQLNLSYISIWVIQVLFFWILLSPMNSASSKSQKAKKSFVIFLLLLLFSVVQFLWSVRTPLEKGDIIKNFMILVLPFTYFYSRHFLMVRKIKWAELLFIIILVSIVFQQIYNFYE